MSVRYLLVGLLLCAERCAAAEIMATINDPDGYTNVRINNRILAVVKSSERFVTVPQDDADWWNVYLASGIFGSMHKSRIRLLPGEPIMKLRYRLKDVLEAAQAEPSDAGRRCGMDYVGLVRRSVSGNSNALIALFEIGCMDGAAAELHSGVLWGVFHLVGDATFADFVRRQPLQFQEYVRERFTDESVTYPISKAPEYLRRHFPRTATLLRLEK